MQTKLSVDLKRDLGIISGLSMVVGTVIGSGIFFKQASVLEMAGGQTQGLLAWGLGGIITLAAGLTIAEVGSRIPKAGGLYSYIDGIYGHLMGFLTGWSQVVVYAPAVIASIGGYAAHLTANFLGLDLIWARWIGVGYICFVMGLNLLGNRIAAGFAVLTTAVKMIPIIILIVYGLFFGRVDAVGETVMQVTATPGGSFGMAVLATLFAYDGWVLVANIRDEMKNPKRDLPLSIVFGVLLILLSYLGVTYGVYRVLPAQEIVNLKDNAVFAVVKSAFGLLGGRIMSLIIIISMLGTMNGKMVAFPRMAYNMSKDGLFPNYLKNLSTKSFVPAQATITIALMAILIAAFTDSADLLSNLAIFTIWIFYVLAFIGVFILRYRQKNMQLKIDFKTPLFPITPLIGIFGGTFVVGSTLITDFKGAMASIIMVLVGIPVYYYYSNKQKHMK